MQRTFLQEKSLNRSLDNAEKSLHVDLSAKSRLLPYSSAADMLGLNDLYIQERDACENYRMIFTVNPVCTNILFNAVTEPVYKEGSYSAVTLVETKLTRDTDTFKDIFQDGETGISGETMNRSGNTVDQIFAVRDTEISHSRIGNFKYHCGYDFFNNHLLRTNEFEHAMLEGDGVSIPFNVSGFNTIFDYAIDFSGNTVERVLTETVKPVDTGLTKEKIRMYQLDTIKTMDTAFHDNFRGVDGWYGFYNTGYINIPNGKLNGKDISINKVLNNEVPCGFVDLYPDRTLYSFIPNVNRYKKRLERNWDCSIVYPYKSDTDMFNRVMINFSGTSEDWETWKGENTEKIPNAVRVLKPKVTYNNVGDEIIEMHSLLRHSLQPGDTVRLFYTTSNYNEYTYEEIFRYPVPVRVISIGDKDGNNEDRCFCIKLYDILSFCGIIEQDEETTEATDEGIEKEEKKIGLKKNGEVTENELSFFYRKIENGYDDRYYFRKFKKLENYEYVEITSADTEDFEAITASATTVIKEPTVINDKSPEVIRFGNAFFKCISHPLTYTQNKIAFGENIYGDRIAQVIFNDDICITGLKDNLGRPLSKIYFTAIKTNRGHLEWYNSGITSADTVEYSHCFGEVTSGLDLPMDEGSTDYNVRKLYNVFSAYTEYNQEYSAGLSLALYDAPIGSYSGTPMPIESGITDNSFEEFYGDVVEFSKINFMEKTLEKVYHRFNTAQRECLVNDKYFDINYDELVGDIYDVEQI